ncbi:unnamed protein product [Parnassius apollo]|uniref:(apollo) hypothetical protein n=1 Tax=Parnassius apollo TaxID=110799 RepID=A0A8S3WBU6_PARAO|nr:unnamed protein product [Parnassius apollo]
MIIKTEASHTDKSGIAEVLAAKSGTSKVPVAKSSAVEVLAAKSGDMLMTKSCIEDVLGDKSMPILRLTRRFDLKTTLYY